MDKDNNTGNSRFIITGIVLLIIGIVLFVVGVTRIFDGLWFLMFFAIPLNAAGIALIMIPLSKKLSKNLIAKNFALMKEIKEELSAVEPIKDKMLCSFCGEANSCGDKFCSQCGEPLYKVCPYCNARLSDNGKFCSQCGKEIK